MHLRESLDFWVDKGRCRILLSGFSSRMNPFLSFLTQDGGYLNILNCITLSKVQNLSETYHVENIADGCKWYNLFSGFTLVGNTRLKCRKGVWSSSLPTCTGIFGKLVYLLKIMHDGPLFHLYQHHHNNPDHKDND